MSKFKIGVIVDCFRLGIKEGIQKAREVGASGIQVYSTNGPMAPENLSAKQRKELLDIVTSNGLIISALCGDLGGGFMNPENNVWKIEKSKRIMDLAKDLDTNIVTTHIGVVPRDANNPRWSVMQEACEILAEYGDQVGAYFAIETGPEMSDVLRRFLDSLRSKGVRVNLDPANLVMVSGDDPVQAVYNLKNYIIHTHAKDGIMLRKANPEIVYGVIEKTNQSEPAYREVPLGDGGVNFVEYLKALDAIGYDGFLTIEREVGDDPEKDIRTAVKFLNDMIRKINA